MIVMKFGGSSLADAGRIRRVRAIVHRHRDQRPVVVVSALRGITDDLLTLARRALSGDFELIEPLRRRHLDAAQQLRVPAAPVDELFAELSRLIQGVSLVKELTPRTLDQRVRRVVSLVELVEFLEGARRKDSNLPEGHLPVKFKGFALEKYLPRCAKPNLKISSYERESDSASALVQHFGEEALHKIDLEAWEVYKAGRLNGTLAFSRRRCANSTVDKEFDCLRRILNYAVQLGLLKRNILLAVRGLKNESRRSVWLRKPEIERLLGCCEHWLRDLLEFRVLTGARPTEALLFGERNIDWRREELWLTTLKKRSSGEHRRYFSMPSLGSRLQRLLARLKLHPKTGYFFARADGSPYPLATVDKAFARARKLASLDRVTAYDLRGTFAMHRAMVVQNFRQLQAEMGHSSPVSIQSYLDEARRFRPEESIFYGQDAESNTGQDTNASINERFPGTP